MDSEKVTPELAEPYLRSVLATAGLDVEYIRAQGNWIFYRDAAGEEVPVLDLVGGYGSLMLGHNNPDINEYAQKLLARETPVHAQFSKHPYANDLAITLNRLLHRELDTEEPYYAIFANSGAEAIEAAVKHAELDRQLRLKVVVEEVEAGIEETLMSVNAGNTTFSKGISDIEALVEQIRRDNRKKLDRGPLFLALEGGFHGKLVGSVQYTHNEVYRAPFHALAAQAIFVPLNAPEHLREIVQQERVELDSLIVVDGEVRLAKYEIPIFCAFLIEPVQGEGGIHEVTREFASTIQEVTEKIDCPIIVDEIQSGMGRTGSFLSSSQIGLRGDYYTLAKTLGGGVAKSAVMLVRRGRYREAFEMVHSSTFAKDSFSCLVALRVLEILESDGGRVYDLASQQGKRIRDTLSGILVDFPDVLAEVRGRGLLLGLEFIDQSESDSPSIREAANSGFFGYHLAGYLLREHRIRVFPTSSAINTLRFEPSAYITDSEIEKLEKGLREMCQLLKNQDTDLFRL